MFCRKCGARLEDHAQFCPACGEAVTAPQRVDTGVERIIPYRNIPALVGYYVGVFSLIPFFGLLLVPVAIVLGMVGLSHAGRHPEAHGRAHAWVAISLALLSVAYQVGVVCYVMP